MNVRYNSCDSRTRIQHLLLHYRLEVVKGMSSDTYLVPIVTLCLRLKH